MVKIDNIIGDIIFISFRDVERLQEIGIGEMSGHYMLKGYDQLGLWLEHPGILIQHMEDDKGRPVPPDQQYQEDIDAVFMVHWDNINTLMHYPNRKGFDFPEQHRRIIGFRFKDKQKSKEE
mgnify:CR=1 FL=1